MIKKSLIAATLLTTVLIVPITTFAEEVENVDEVQVTEVSELVMIPTGIGTKDSIKLNTTATITTGAGFGSVEGSGKASKIMDSIYVKARVYSANGVLGDQKSGTQNKTDYHSVKTSNAYVGWSNNYGFANATYKKAGYNTVSNEVRVNQ